MKTVTGFIYLGSKITLDSADSCEKKKKDASSLEEKLWNTIQHTKKQRHYITSRCLYSQSYGLARNREWMWEVDHKESWAPKNWCFWIVVLKKTPESSLDGKEIQSVHPKGNQSGICIGRTDNEADGEQLTHWKRPWCWKRLKAGREGDNRGWDGYTHYRLDGHEFE